MDNNVNESIKSNSSLRILNAPTGINLTHQNAGVINVYWDDLPSETGYEIWRSTGSVYSKIADLPQNSNSYLDINLAPNTRYYYQIRGIQNGTPLAWSSSVSTVAAQRNNGEEFKLKRMRFVDEASLAAVEKWASGAPEIRLRVSKGFPTNSNVDILTFGKYEPSKRSDIVGTWWNKDEIIFNNWSINSYNTVATFTWKEEDWNSFVTFKINGKYEQKVGTGSILIGGEATFNNNSGSGNIGASTDVFFWQPKTLTYQTGGFQWELYY